MISEGGKYGVEDQMMVIVLLLIFDKRRITSSRPLFGNGVSDLLNTDRAPVIPFPNVKICCPVTELMIQCIGKGPAESLFALTNSFKRASVRGKPYNVRMSVPDDNAPRSCLPNGSPHDRKSPQCHPNTKR